MNFESIRLGCKGGERKKQRRGGGCGFVLVAPLLAIGRWTAGHTQPPQLLPPRGDTRYRCGGRERNDASNGHRGRGGAMPARDLEAPPSSPSAVGGSHSTSSPGYVAGESGR